MASQVAHIIYTVKYFESLELEKSAELKEGEIPDLMEIKKDEFILGCVFPDIRRIDTDIRRKDTHLHFDKIDLDFSQMTSFEAGWKFHLYADMRREEILNKYNFYSLKNTTDIYSHPAKLLEDELLYDYYDNWEKISYYFNHPPYIETIAKITPETFNLWYAVLSKYIEKKPDNRSMKNFLIKNLRVASRAPEIITSLAKLRENKKAVEILKKVKDEIIPLNP